VIGAERCLHGRGRQTEMGELVLVTAVRVLLVCGFPAVHFLQRRGGQVEPGGCIAARDDVGRQRIDQLLAAGCEDDGDSAVAGCDCMRVGSALYSVRASLLADEMNGAVFSIVCMSRRISFNSIAMSLMFW